MSVTFPRPVALLCSLALLASCRGPGAALPEGVRTYLDALVADRHRQAYERTELSDIASSFGTGAALSLEHFEAFYEANPVKAYAIEDVTKIEQRSIERANQPGTPYYIVDVRLTIGGRTSRETLSVLGDILPRVQVEPDRVFLGLPSGTRSILVDGIETPVRSARVGDRRAFPVMLLRGAHQIDVGDRRIRIHTDPLRVLAGQASIERPDRAPAIVRLS